MATRNNDDIILFRNDELVSERIFIGNGGMGVVSLYKWNKTDSARGMHKDQIVAVKRLDIAGPALDKAILEEANFLWKLHEKCNSVLRMYGLTKLNSRISLVLEYMERGNIADFFSKINCFGLSATNKNLTPLKLRIAEQVCQGMIFLHELCILHCDLKAANVLLDCDLNAKICDFGLAKIKQLTTRPSSTPEQWKRGKLNNHPAGTISHVAPELLYLPSKATFKSDVYSYGILLWEVLTGKEPYKEASCAVVIIKEVTESKRPDLNLIPEDCPNILRKVMTESWQQKPNKRPTFKQILPQLSGADKEGIHAAVKLANEAWERHNEAETVPKSVESRASTRRNHTSLNFVTPYERLDNYQQCTPFVANNLNVSLGDSEICISEESNTEEHRRLLDHSEYGNTRQRQPEVIKESMNPSSKRTILAFGILLAIFVSLMMAALAFFVAQYIEGNDKRQIGCCLDCFNPSDPYLNNTCGPDNNTGGDTRAIPGSDCYLSCASGYVLNGSVTKLRCNDDGVWSGPLPFCRKIRQCPILSPPANSGSVKCTNHFYENSKCTFQCPDGYRLRFPGNDTRHSDTFDVTCVEDSISNFYWTDQEPYCEEIVTCQPPTTDVSVRTSCTPDLKPAQYHNGTECKFSCEPPTALSNNETSAKCLDNGTWNNTSEIQCVKGCPYFVGPTNCNYTCTKERLYDSRCIFSCHENFTMIGSDNMVCHSGKWTEKPPSCRCPACRSGKKCENLANYMDTWKMFNFNETMTSVNYDGHVISCYATAKPSISHGCQCRDNGLNRIKQCNDPDTLVNACQKAFSSLVMILVQNGTYTLPCDANLMPKGC